MTPTKADFVAVLEAVQEGRLLSTHQLSIIVTALRGAAYTPTMAEEEAAYDAAMGEVRAERWAKAEKEAVRNGTLTKPEISLLPALLAKMDDQTDVLREIRDVMRRRDDPAARDARSRLVAMVGTPPEQASS